MTPMEQIDQLLEREVSVVDILPERVPAEGAAAFCALERRYLSGKARRKLYRKFARILLKLNCYRSFSLLVRDQWEKGPSSDALEGAVERCMRDEGACAHILLDEGECLIVVSGGETHMDVYGAGEAVRRLLAALASAEGLFFWKPE